MAILTPDPNSQALQIAMSRNRATQGRANAFPLDIYMQKGQIVARQMPTSRVDFPSEAQNRNRASVVREREIEKQLDLGDVMALKWRANKSRYNWWEVLGKIYISREFNSPGSVTGISKVWFRNMARHIEVNFSTDNIGGYYIMDFGTVDEYVKNHYWRYATHREAGLENRLRGIEVLKYKICWAYHHYPYNGHGTVTQYYYKTYNLENHIIMIRCIRRKPGTSQLEIHGETGLIYFNFGRPWWLNAPFPFMP